MQHAIIQNQKVVSILSFSTEESVQTIAKTYEQVVNIEGMDPMPSVGWNYSNGIFFPDEITGKKITRLAFRNRFTSQEKLNLYGALSTPQGIMLKIYLDDLALASYVDLERADTIAGVQLLEQIGILGTGRAEIILNTSISDVEKFKE